mmetsp:Transcript_16861/g.43275  ORF Transcript_16861/g.43275 Transcript_16861/m.43275 type:complete len:135 (-) Transcript_16861:502-906(-)
MAFANAVRFNTTVSASDARLAHMSYAQKITEQRLQRSQERSKWYQLTEAERSEILFPSPKKIHTNYEDATPEQTRQVESHFKGEGMMWRPQAESQKVSTKQIADADPQHPINRGSYQPKKPWHAGGGGYEGISA